MEIIATWLTHPEVSCWNFTSIHKQKVEENIKNSRVIICPDKESFLRTLPEADTVFVWDFKQAWLELAPKLQRIITPAAGKDFLEVEQPSEILVEYSAFHGRLIGETVMAMMLSHSRGILTSYNLQEISQWPRKELDMQMRLLRGSLITILGFGSIGTWLGRMAKPFGATLCGIKRTPVPPPDYFDGRDRIAGIDEIDSVLPNTDHLVLCLPRAKETTNILNKRRISLLPNHAAVYNVGRGNSVDDTALVEALRSGRISAAYLDVFKEEPLPADSPLRTCPNCFIMPHASGLAPEFMDFFVEEFISRHGDSPDYNADKA